jgi:hypothetical protein
MTTTILVILGVLTLFAGCGALPYADSYGASPEMSAESECERTGGVWRAIPAVCEYPGKP